MLQSYSHPCRAAVNLKAYYFEVDYEYPCTFEYMCGCARAKPLVTARIIINRSISSHFPCPPLPSLRLYQGCDIKLTLQTYFKSPFAGAREKVYCHKCGPKLASSVGADSVDLARAKQNAGGRLVNDQIRNVPLAAKRRPHSYYREIHSDDEVDLDALDDEPADGSVYKLADPKEDEALKR